MNFGHSLRPIEPGGMNDSPHVFALVQGRFHFPVEPGEGFGGVGARIEGGDEHRDFSRPRRGTAHPAACLGQHRLEVCDLLLRDEARHVEFHRDRFAADQRAWLPLERAVWAFQFQVIFLGAATVA